MSPAHPNTPASGPESASLSEHLTRALSLIDAAVADAAARVVAGPDNPAIRRLSGSNEGAGEGAGTGPGNTGVIAFAINFSEIGRRGLSSSGSWDPFSHDWLAQYRYARELLEKRRFAALRDLLSGGGYRDPSHGMRVFAVEVIEHIKGITGDLRQAVALTDAVRMSSPAESAAAPSPASRRRPR